MPTLEEQAAVARLEINRQARAQRAQVRAEAERALRQEPRAVEVGHTVAVIGTPQTYTKEVRSWQEEQFAAIAEAQRKSNIKLAEAVKEAQKPQLVTYEGISPEEQEILDQGYGIEEINRRRELAAQQEYEAQSAAAQKEFEKDNVLVASNQWVSKEEYNKLSSEDKKLIQQIGINQFNAQKDREYQAALAEEKAFKAANIEIKPDTWIDKSWWDSLTLDQQQSAKVDEVTGEVTVTTTAPGEQVYEIEIASGEKIEVPAAEWEGMNEFEKLTKYLDRAPTYSEMQGLARPEMPDYGGIFNIPILGGILSRARLGTELLIRGIQSPVESYWRETLPEAARLKLQYEKMMYPAVESTVSPVLVTQPGIYGKIFGPTPDLSKVDWSVPNKYQAQLWRGTMSAFESELGLGALVRPLSPVVTFGDITGEQWKQTGISAALLATPLILKGVGALASRVGVSPSLIKLIPPKLRTSVQNTILAAKEAGLAYNELQAATKALKAAKIGSPFYSSALLKVEAATKRIISVDLKFSDTLATLSKVKPSQLAKIEKLAKMPGLKSSIEEVIRTSKKFNSAIKTVASSPSIWEEAMQPKIMVRVNKTMASYHAALDKFSDIIQPRTPHWRVPIPETLQWELTPVESRFWTGFVAEGPAPSVFTQPGWGKGGTMSESLYREMYGKAVSSQLAPQAWEAPSGWTLPKPQLGRVLTMEPIPLFGPKLELALTTPYQIPLASTYTGLSSQLTGIIPSISATPMYFIPSLALSRLPLFGLAPKMMLTESPVPEIELLPGYAEVVSKSGLEVQRALSPLILPRVTTSIFTREATWLSPAQLQAVWQSPSEMLLRSTNLQNLLRTNLQTGIFQKTGLEQLIGLQVESMTKLQQQLQTATKVKTSTTIATKTSLSTQLTTKIGITPKFFFPWLPKGEGKEKKKKKPWELSGLLLEPYPGMYPGLILHFPTPLEPVRDITRPRPVIKKTRITLRRRGTYAVAGFREVR